MYDELSMLLARYEVLRCLILRNGGRVEPSDEVSTQLRIDLLSD